MNSYPSSPSTTSAALIFENVDKRYGGVVALEQLSLTVPEGGCFGLLGPNGAGKSTAVSIAATLRAADSGSVRVFGDDVRRARSAVRRQIGIVFQENCLDRELTAREHLQFHARLYRLDHRDQIVPRALDAAGLSAAADRPVRGFSGGMARRLEIARGMLPRPRLLFLDEPTLGLDVAARRGVWEQLRSLTEERTTLFLTTHAMEEADTLCDRLAILDGGRIVASGTPEELKADVGADLVRIRLRRNGGAEETLRGFPGVRGIDLEGPETAEGSTLRIFVENGPERLAALLDALRPFSVLEVHLERPTLESVFLHHTGHTFAAAESEQP